MTTPPFVRIHDPAAPLVAVHLHGHLAAAFGAGPHRFAIATAAEALRALAAAFPGFLAALKTGSYRLIRGAFGQAGEAGEGKAGGRDLDESMLGMAQAGRDLHIVPVPAGAKRGGAAKIILGVALVAVAIWAAPAGTGLLGANLGAEAFSVFGASISYGNLAMLGVTMTLQGASAMLSPQPKAASFETADRRASFLFNGPVTSVEQGGAVPVVYGSRMRVGGTVISAALAVEDMP